MKLFATELLSGILELLYPPICLVCGGDEREPFCHSCQKCVVPVLPPFCDRCGALVDAGRLVCESCERQNPPYDWVHSLGRYEGSLEKAIHLMKYEGKTALAPPLGKLLAHSLLGDERLFDHRLENSLLFDFIVPTPLHPARQRERGFNQSELLAQTIAKVTGWKLNANGLIRVKKTRIQARLNRVERIGNVIGAFETVRPFYFKGKSILLVDDVMTTSSTLRECARVLKNDGANRVCLAVLARG